MSDDHLWRRRWARLRTAMRDELYLAERDYGMTDDLSAPRYRDLRDQNTGRAAVLRKMLDEMRRTTRRT